MQNALKLRSRGNTKSNGKVPCSNRDCEIPNPDFISDQQHIKKSESTEALNTTAELSCWTKAIFKTCS